jgi:hypothetical protein
MSDARNPLISPYPPWKQFRPYDHRHKAATEKTIYIGCYMGLYLLHIKIDLNFFYMFHF